MSSNYESYEAFLAREQSRRPPDFLSGHAYQAGSEDFEATLRRRQILFARSVARMKDTRLSKYQVRGIIVQYIDFTESGENHNL